VGVIGASPLWRKFLRPGLLLTRCVLPCTTRSISPFLCSIHHGGRFPDGGFLSSSCIAVFLVVWVFSKCPRLRNHSPSHSPAIGFFREIRLFLCFPPLFADYLDLTGRQLLSLLILSCVLSRPQVGLALLFSLFDVPVLFDLKNPSCD